MMKIGLHMGPYLNRSFEEFFPKLVDWGYESIELCAWGGPQNIAKPGVKETLKIIEETKLELSCIAAHVGWVGKEEGATDAALEHTKRCLDIASELGCPVIATETGLHVAGVDRHNAWDRVVRGFTAAVEYAEKRQVRIGLEPHFNSIVFTWESALKLLKEIDSPYFRINCDSSHWHACGLDDEVAVEKLKDYIIHVHLKDYSFMKPSLKDGIYEGIFKGNALGDGDYDLEQHVAQLQRIGYSGALSGEFTFVAPEDLDTVTKRSAKYMQFLLKKYR